MVGGPALGKPNWLDHSCQRPDEDGEAGGGACGSQSPTRSESSADVPDVSPEGPKGPKWFSLSTLHILSLTLKESEMYSQSIPKIVSISSFSTFEVLKAEINIFIVSSFSCTALFKD